MKEQYVSFIDENVDGCGTNITCIAKLSGKEINSDVIDKVTDAIYAYQQENPEYPEYETDDCLEIAEKILKQEGYDVGWVDVAEEIRF